MLAMQPIVKIPGLLLEIRKHPLQSSQPGWSATSCSGQICLYLFLYKEEIMPIQRKASMGASCQDNSVANIQPKILNNHLNIQEALCLLLTHHEYGSYGLNSNS
jgi:hypothetical protein